MPFWLYEASCSKHLYMKYTVIGWNLSSDNNPMYFFSYPPFPPPRDRHYRRFRSLLLCPMLVIGRLWSAMTAICLLTVFLSPREVGIYSMSSHCFYMRRHIEVPCALLRRVHANTWQQRASALAKICRNSIKECVTMAGSACI